MRKQFIVIGLGRFGSSICKELNSLGHEVLAIDMKPERVDYVRDFVSYLSKEYSILELVASRNIANQTLLELDLRAKYQCTVLTIKRGEDVNISPLPDGIIREEDILVVIGHGRDLKRVEEKGL